MADDRRAVYRAPDKLRTIFGSNTDSKIFNSAIAYKFSPPTMKVTPGMQRGFCKGRQLSLNIVDLDTYSRVYNDLYSPPPVVDTEAAKDLPATALYDF